LGDEKELFEGMQMGTLEATMTTPGVVANFVPSYKILSMPFLYDTREHTF
jgi:TRAP-type C4-dicarboxylate transport system substrate-binding protein